MLTATDHNLLLYQIRSEDFVIEAERAHHLRQLRRAARRERAERRAAERRKAWRARVSRLRPA